MWHIIRIDYKNKRITLQFTRWRDGMRVQWDGDTWKELFDAYLELILE